MSEEKAVSVVDFLDKAEPRFESAPFGMTFEKEKSYAVQLFRQNDYLEKVARDNPLSLLSAMSNVASIGLSLNPAKKQAYLVPRNGQICLDPSYIGMCDLATQSGQINFVQARVVREKDKYVNKGIDQEPLHEYEAFSDRGPIVGAFCVAKTSKGDYLTTEMSLEKLHSVRDRSEYYKKKKAGPWATDEEEMMKKTVIRNGFKGWPKTETMERLEQAVHLSNENEGFAPIVNSPSAGYSDEQKKHFDYLIENSDSIGMHCFMSSLTEGAQTGLYNSFEKGTIGKFKKLVSELQMKGYSQLIDIETVVAESMSSGDDLAAKEVLCDLPQEAVHWLCERNDAEFRAYVNQCLEEERSNAA